MNNKNNRNILAFFFIISLGCTGRSSKHLLAKKELFSKIIYFIKNDQNDSLRHYFLVNDSKDSFLLFERFSIAKTFLRKDFEVNLDSIFCTDSTIYIKDSLDKHDFKLNLYNDSTKIGTISMDIMGKTNNSSVLNGKSNIVAYFDASKPFHIDVHMFDDAIEKTRRYSDSLDNEYAKMKNKNKK